jgi:HEAT repeat protein
MQANESLRAEVMDAFRLPLVEPQLIVPVLTNGLYDVSPLVRAGAAYALSGFGTNSAVAIPRLLELAQDSGGVTQSWMDLAARDLSAIALGKTGAEPERVVPALIAALDDPVMWIRANAARDLGNFGTNASSAVPALLGLYREDKDRGPRTIRSNEPDTIRIVGAALKQIDPEAAAKAGIK